MPNEVAKREEAITAIERLSKEAEALDVFGTKADFAVAIQAAQLVGEIEKWLNTEEIKDSISKLAGTPLGFKTDKKDNQPMYDWPVVRQCATHALISGLGMVGNQFNIIKGQMYVTKEGLFKKLHDIPDLTYSIVPGVTRMDSAGKKGIVPVMIYWTWHGKENEQAIDIPVQNIHEGSVDQAVGKAIRKARKWLFEDVTSTEVRDGEIGDSITIDAASVTVTDAPQPPPVSEARVPGGPPASTTTDPKPTCSESWARCDPPWHSDVSSLGPPELVVRALRDRGKAYTSVKQIPADIAAELLVDDAFRAEVSALADLGGQQ